MTNKNDNLKEKEINEEKTIEQDKLENVSGGVNWAGDGTRPMGIVCGWSFRSYRCGYACLNACANLHKVNRFEEGISPYNFHRVELISPEKCKDCSECAAQKACPSGGHWY